MEPTPQSDPPLLTPKELGRLFLFTILAIMLAQALSLFIEAKYSLLLQEISIVIPSIIYILHKKLPFRFTFRLAGTSASIFFYTMLFSLSVIVLTDELDRVISHFFPMPEELSMGMEQLLQAHTPLDAAWIILAAVVVAGVAEEMLFRGMILRALEQFKDAASAVALSAVFFALVHFNPWGSIQIAVLGFALGYLAWKAQSIWPGVFLHAANNLLAFMWLNLPKESWNWYCGEIHVHYYWLILAALLFAFSLDRFNKACDARWAISELLQAEADESGSEPF